MWLERNQDRHGREFKERRERIRQRNLREIAMWYSHKGKGLLGITEAERAFFYSTFARHREREPSAEQAGMWLSTYRPVLVMCKARAKERLRPERKHKKSSEIRGIGEGCSSADSAGGGEPAEPMLVGPDAGLLDITGGSIS